MRVALFSRNACAADAMGQQFAAKLAFFLQRGAEVRVYLSEIFACRPDVAAVTPIIANANQVWKDDAQREYLLSCDLILAEFGSAYDLLDLLPALTGKGPRIMVDYHGLTPIEWADRPLHEGLEAACRQRAVLWAADAILVHSRFAAEELQQAVGIPSGRIEQIPCWVAEPGSREARQATELRQRHKLNNAKVLLFVGRLARNKQPEKLIEALAQLPAATVAVFVGTHQDVYQERLKECQQLARKLGVADRVRFAGRVDDGELAAWYRAADVLVLPSRHECFGMPVVEAMLRGIPVVGSDTGSLPEVIAHAGLLADVEDARSLAQQANRYLMPSSNPATRKVALVTHRFGTHFAGGAEQSLRLMATALQSQGYTVEVFTTCNDDASRWANTLREGTTDEAGFCVHRFPIDAHDPAQLGEAYQRIQQTDGQVSPAIEAQYLQHSLGSQALIKALTERKHEFAAIITGPYLFKLTYDVAKAFGEQVLLAPCFHDEALARLQAFQDVYRQVGGLLFHTQSEATWTAEILGITQPRQTVVGTVLSSDAMLADADKARQRFGERYLVYCGRYCPEKGLDRLIQYLESCNATSPQPLTLVCLGQGPMKLPTMPWLIDAGFVDEQEKRDIIQGAMALVNLSRHESLSIVALEAWALGVPVIVDAGCAVLREQVQRSGGGAIVSNSTEFAQIIHRWMADAEERTTKGARGRELVEREYLSAADYGLRLKIMVETMYPPLREVASRQGLERAVRWRPTAWEDRLAHLVEHVQVAAIPPEEPSFKLKALTKKLEIACGIESGTLTIKLSNRGNTMLAASGPAAATLHLSVRTAADKRIGDKVKLPLSQALIPGQQQLLVAALDWPQVPGKYRIKVSMKQGQQSVAKCKATVHIKESITRLDAAHGSLGPIVQTARQVLAEAKQHEALPEDYCDVTEGKLANFKKMLKRKLLNNFRQGYVDVAFRQQSTLNRKLIAVMSLMLESVSSQDVAGQQAQLQRRLAKLESKIKQERRRRQVLQRQLAALAPPAATLLEGEVT